MDMKFPKSSPNAISLAEAKRMLKEGNPLCDQHVRCTLDDLDDIATSFLPVGGQPFEECQEWQVTKFPPDALLAKKYDDGKLKLKIGMIPRHTHGVSLNRLLSETQWDAIRARVFEDSNHQCAICGSSQGLSCHEIWDFQEPGIQRLIRLEPRCKMCHFVEHFGLAQLLARKGQLDLKAVVGHFCKVNGCKIAHFQVHKERALASFIMRSKRSWIVDFGEYANLVPLSVRGPYQPQPIPIRPLTKRPGARKHRAAGAGVPHEEFWKAVESQGGKRRGVK